MRRERFATAAAGALSLGNLRFFKPGQRGYLLASGATADAITATYGGDPVSAGNINIEGSADVVEPPRDLVGTFVARAAAELIVSVAGTVTGTHVDVWMLQPGEERPW